MYFRTDMAKECLDRVMSGYAKEHEGEPDGIRYTEKKYGKTTVSTVEIYNEAGAELLSKPVGKYVTVNVGRLWEADAETFVRCADIISSVINSLRQKKDGCVLVAGVGNRYVTADALGPYAVKYVTATHHVSAAGTLMDSGLGDAAVISPGVLSQTGIEAAEQIKAAAKVVSPSLIIVIDALAAAGIETLSTSVQITDTGISPGSGVGNDRGELSRRTLGAQVIAVGVPTVIDAAALLPDGCGEREYKRLKGCYVCPKDSDRSVLELAHLIGCAVNRVCHKDLSYEDMAYI